MPQRRPRILFASMFTPGQDVGTGFMQRLNILYKGLQQIGDVTHFQPTPETVRSLLVSSVGNQTSAGVLMEEASNAAASCWSLRRHQPTGSNAQAFRRMMPESFDVVFLHRLAMSWWTGWTDPKRTIVDLDDLVSHYYLQGLALGNPAVRLLKQLRCQWVRITERRALDAFRFSLVCSNEDRNYVHQHPKVLVVPNSYWPSPKMDETPIDHGGSRLVFIGSMTFPPNVNGVAWFVREVLPIIRRQRPDAQLQVVGRTQNQRHGDWSWVDAPGVEFVGSVADIAPYHQGADIEVCPLLQGRGTRIKILEALAFAKPVVSTTIGAYGIPFDESSGIFRADDAGEFANQCLRLMSDSKLRQQSSTLAKERVEASFSPKAAQAIITTAVETILSEQGLVLP